MIFQYLFMKIRINLFNNCFHQNLAKFCLNLRKLLTRMYIQLKTLSLFFLDFLNFIGCFQFFSALIWGFYWLHDFP